MENINLTKLDQVCDSYLTELVKMLNETLNSKMPLQKIAISQRPQTKQLCLSAIDTNTEQKIVFASVEQVQALLTEKPTVTTDLALRLLQQNAQQHHFFSYEN